MINYQEFLDYMESLWVRIRYTFDTDAIYVYEEIRNELIRNHEAFERQRVIDFHTVADARLPDFHQPSEGITLKASTEEAVVITIYKQAGEIDG